MDRRISTAAAVMKAIRVRKLRAEAARLAAEVEDHLRRVQHADVPQTKGRDG